MNKYTIVPEDGFVSIDGIGYSGLVFNISPTIHAVQWHGAFGEIEYKPVLNTETKQLVKAPNEIFEDPAKFQVILNIWAVADAITKEEEAASEQVGGVS